MKDTPSGLERVLQGQSLGFILLKCQQVLKGAGRCMSTFDLQAALVHATGGQGTKYGQDYYRQLFTDPTFISVLRKNARLDFDQKTRRWSFKSPFGDYTGKDALLQGISKEQDGLEVSAELVEYHPLMADWIHQLLEAKLIRAVRAAKPTRCKYFSPESGFVCDLYEPKASKCDNCSVLKGLILYPRVPENIEAHDIFLDDDLRESWAAVSSFDQFQFQTTRSICPKWRPF